MDMSKKVTKRIPARTGAARPPETPSRGALSSFEQFENALEELGYAPVVSRAGKGTALCPAHDDHDPSLSFQKGDVQPVVAICRSQGCSWADITTALGFSGDGDGAEYEYLDTERVLAYVVRRLPDKVGFPVFRPVDGQLVPGLGEVTKILYRLPDVIEAVEAREVVYVVEGEQDADSVSAQGVCATTNPFGAGKWDDSFSDVLAGAEVRVIIDDDPAGYRHGAVVVASLDGVAKSVAVFKAAEGNDATDHLDAGLSLDDLVPVPVEDLAEAPPVELPVGYRLWSPEDDGHRRPTLDSDALHGLLGDAVAVFEEDSEVDPVAVLVQLLAVGGAILGRDCWVQIGSTRHHGNLFVCLVGGTSTGRKGMALDNVLQFSRLVDPDFVASNFTSGLGSGEVLVQLVRDDEMDEDGELVARGVDDKRLVVKGAEFSTILTVAQRDGQILSGVLREAFDAGVLRNLTKQSRATATGATISVIGHITPHELLRRLDQTEKANGFANRFGFFYTERRRLVPSPRPIDDEDLEHIARDLAKALEEAIEDGGPWRRSQDAERLWETIYPELTTPPPGMLEELLARGAPIVMRLALVFACADPNSTLGEINVDHLRAALALWRYSAETVEHVFGDSQGDADADQLLKAIRMAGRDGLSFTEQSKQFSGHREKKSLQRVRQQLEDRKLIATGQAGNGSVSVAISPVGAST